MTKSMESFQNLIASIQDTLPSWGFLTFIIVLLWYVLGAGLCVFVCVRECERVESEEEGGVSCSSYDVARPLDLTSRSLCGLTV